MIKTNLITKTNLKVFATKEITIREFGNNLKFLIDNVNNIYNDPTLNRLMRELDYNMQKGMSSSVTTGHGASAGYYIIKGESLVSILKKQISEKEKDIEYEEKKSKKDEKNIKINKNLIELFNEYVEYFTNNIHKYFIINGQHRFDSIKRDYNGLISFPKNKKQKNNQFRYSNLVVDINGEIITENVDSLHDIKLKLCSAGDWNIYEWAKDIDYDTRQEIFDKYLEACQIYIYEITDAVSFSSVMEFVQHSNSSSSWDSFLFKSVQSFSPYSKWFRETFLGEKTNELTEWGNLIYGNNSPLKITSGSFKRTDGGFQYLIGSLVSTIYSKPESLYKFEIKSKDEISEILFKDDSPFLKEWGSQLLTDISKVIAVITKIKNAENSKVYKEIYESPSFFIFCIYALNYYRSEFRYTHENESWKLKITDTNLQYFIEDIMIIFHNESRIAHMNNTSFWNTDEGKEKIEYWKNKLAFRKNTLEYPVSAKDFKIEWQSEWGGIEKKCQDNSTTDIKKSFRRHIGRELISWGRDHSCVLNTLNSHVEQAFQHIKVEMNDSRRIPFSYVGFESCTSLPKPSKLISSDYEEMYLILDSKTETDRVHSYQSKSKGGSSDVSNIELGSRVINRKQKDVI